MTISLPIETAGIELEQRMKSLYPGDTITLTDPNGLPLAVVVPLVLANTPTPIITDWEKHWEMLAQAISQSWQGDQSAVETLAEMRR